MIKILFILLMYLVISFTLPLRAQSVIRSALSDILPVNNISASTADSIFRFVVSKGDVIEFEDCNICKSRAHITARVIEKYFPDVTAGKAWLFADCKRGSQREKYRYKPEVYLEYNKECSSWGYHVAPIIITAADTFVIDPATQNSAVPLSQWAGRLVPKNGEGFLVIKRPEYFIYPDDNNNLFEDEKAVWDDAGENLLDESFSRSTDEVVRAALGLIEPWRMNERVRKIKLLIGTDQ
jgi:hypothetical protein